MKVGLVRKLWKIPAETQRARLEAYGVTRIFEAGKDDGDEGVVHEAVRWFRGRPGVIVISGDMRVLGMSQKAIDEACSYCVSNNVTVEDIEHPEFKTMFDQARHAKNMLAGHRIFRGDARNAKRRGKMGGDKRAENDAIRRAEAVPDEAVRRFMAITKARKQLTLRLLSWALGKGFSIGALTRNYYDGLPEVPERKPRAAKRKRK